MSTEVGDLDAALAALYQLPLEQFVATRDQLARRLRAAGDRATARQVGLRRPPVSAWAANQLGHAAPNAVAELLEAGAALRQAQQAAVAGQLGAARQLRTATAHLRAAITRPAHGLRRCWFGPGMRPATPPWPGWRPPAGGRNRR